MSKSSKKHKHKNRQTQASTAPRAASATESASTQAAAAGSEAKADALKAANAEETQDLQTVSTANATAPALEPLTPERAAEWNRYYDMYVTLFVLALIFLVSSNLISDSSIWSLLAMGKESSAQSAPVTKGVGSLTKADQSWANIPWAFEWAMYEVHNASKESASIFGPSLTWLSGSPYKDRIPNAKKIWDEHFAAGVLIVINSLLMTLAAWLLMRIRHPGPGLWWAAVCVAIALGGTAFPPELGRSRAAVRVGLLDGDHMHAIRQAGKRRHPRRDRRDRDVVTAHLQPDGAKARAHLVNESRVAAHMIGAGEAGVVGKQDGDSRSCAWSARRLTDHEHAAAVHAFQCPQPVDVVGNDRDDLANQLLSKRQGHTGGAVDVGAVGPPLIGDGAHAVRIDKSVGG